MPGAAFVGRRAIARAVDQPAHLGATREGGGKAVIALELRKLGLQRPRLARRIRHIHIAEAAVAIDAEFGDARIHQVQRLQGHVPGDAGVGAAQLRLEGFLPACKTGNRLPAVAPGCAAANPPGLQHGNPVATPRQLHRRRQPGKSGPHHQHVCAHRALQRRQRRIALHAGLVIVAAVEFGVALQEGRAAAGGSPYHCAPLATWPHKYVQTKWAAAWLVSSAWS